MTEHRPAGMLISFLGVDGIGKTTLATALAEDLTERGLAVVQTSWRRSLGTAETPWPGVALRQLWLETFRLIYANARGGDGPIALPADFRDWAHDAWEDRLAETAVSGVRPVGPLAAALVELAGNVVYFAEVIRPAIDDGKIVLLDTFPYKHVLKELTLARHTATREGTPLIDSLDRFMTDFFGDPSMQPQIGVFVDGPLELAYAWRTSQNGRVGLLEDLRAAGLHGESSFVAMQQATATRFREVAQRWGWLRHEVDGSGIADNVSRGLRLILGHRELARRVGAGVVEGV